jgi:hypothetical protein
VLHFNGAFQFGHVHFHGVQYSTRLAAPLVARNRKQHFTLSVNSSLSLASLISSPHFTPNGV